MTAILLLFALACPIRAQNWEGNVHIIDPLPLPVTANISNSSVSVSGSSVTAFQGGSWNVNTGAGTPARVDPTGTTAQPVTQSGTWGVGIESGSNTIGKVDQGAGGASAWKVDGSAVTQPISGTITADQGSPPWAMTVGNFPAVQAVSQSGSWTTTPGTGTWTIAGAVTAAQYGSYTVTPGTGTWSVSAASGSSISISSGSQTVGVTNGRLNVDISAPADKNDYAADSGQANAAVSGSDNPIILLVNLSTNTVNVRLKARVFGTDVTNTAFVYRTFLNPVVSSSGTALSIANVAISTSAAKAQAFLLPTLSSNGTAIDSYATGQNAQALRVDDNESISVTSGKKLAITARPPSNNRTVFISVRWSEQ